MRSEEDLRGRVLRAKVAAHGRWRDIFESCGIASAYLDGRACPCPVCGGRDRFTFDNKFGNGDYFCRGCGGGDGLSLIAKFCQCSFMEAVRRVESFCGIEHQCERRKSSLHAQLDEKKESIRAMMRIWAEAFPISSENAAGRYLMRRGLELDGIGSELRFHPGLVYESNDDCVEKAILPAMIARVTDATGCMINIHRTYITSDGDKANVLAPKKLMPGSVKGGAVRFVQPQSVLGLAEGIETAIAAATMFSVPVWATLGVTNLEGFTTIPPQVKKVIIFSDNDDKFSGQAGAYVLAHKLSCSGLNVSVRIAPHVGEDWLDEYVRLRKDIKC